ncbi:hypothetical protein M9H77_03732 [Catharanthus roseus]|uniref:Uncharacterized protein n=1 Tax=Catharanthus roseus TaxID=4058 RepID=A0ACC0CC38_CATRO|nr:hypothetical protein M9H77_03732 [Catharanthus roseus]
MMSGLGYTITNINHTTRMYVTLHECSYAKFGKLEEVFVKDSLSRAEKRNLIKKHKLRRPPLMCDYCKMIEHITKGTTPSPPPCAYSSTVTTTVLWFNIVEDTWPCIFSSLPYQGAHGYLSLKREGQIPFTISNIQAMMRK